MAKCAVCGKGAHFGNNVSHSHRRSNRMWKSNIKRVSCKSERNTEEVICMCFLFKIRQSRKSLGKVITSVSVLLIQMLFFSLPYCNFKGGYPKDNRLFSAFMQNQTATADLTPAVRRAVQGLP